MHRQEVILTIDANVLKEGERRWVKKAQVHSVPLLTFPINIPVGVFYIKKCGTEADVIVRLDRIYKFLQCCTNCPQQAIESGTYPVCTVWCKECFFSQKSS